ncbi:rod shape-determining protein MreC [Conexibacter sp. JD483]|uniref:rod shape-determining protein MreC n=1 Tax=unclassified Conexibacter TaxID=2627773 RepID=UPI002721FAAE|nr:MULTISPECIES: rod shape-determining protein MreC [unclassified Conexibacter]MDO8187629.1 rod shape-determining protein MreC [Conexibacter sp. CPCC 205706]MDO8201039.1 rod shape-determining protein MreC [Conexibacter sp. CPCC 205762]MDR9371212.1 rod shape-determining protein MreC [Conexibacter sp. JD483]
MVSLILLTAYFGEDEGSPLHGVQRGVIAVLSPIQEGASRALKPARDLFGWFGDTMDAKKERDQLRAQRDRLLRDVVGLQTAQAENRQLRGLVGLGDRYDTDAYTPVTGRVTFRNPNNLFRDTIGIDVGTGAGVGVGDAVISGSGLVGHVSTATGNASIVTLITDQRSTVGARLARSQDLGLVRPSLGDPLDLQMSQLPRRAEARVNDIVVTSGTIATRLDSPYPPGIPIGTVTRVDPEELASDNRIHLAPLADLRHLDFVQVLTNSGAAGTARAQAGP